MKNPLRFQLLKKSSLARTVYLIFFLIALIPSLLISFTFYSVAADMISGYAQESSNNNLQQAYHSIRSIIDSVDTTLFSLTIDDRITNLVRSGQLSVGSQNRYELREDLSSALNQNRNLIEIITLETESETIFSLHRSNLSQPDLLRISDPDLEERISALHGNPCWIGVDNSVGTLLPDDAADRYIRVSTEVTGVTIAEHLGYLNFFIRSSVFQNVLDSIPYSTGQGILIFDDQYSVISASSDVPEDLFKALGQSSLASFSDLKVVTAEGIYIVSSVTERSSGWHILSFLSEKAAVDSLRAKTSSLLFPLLFLPLICLVLTDLFFTRFYHSLSPLLHAMQKISGGNIKERVPIGNDYLIDSISTTMNSMLDQYEHLISVNAHQEALLITSRLKILRGQISPHYLYNTLDSINWKLIEEGNIEASSAISKLGNVLRYSINESSSTVCLKEELSVIDQYLQICKFRFEDRLRYSVSVEDRLEDYEIPRFILQPIVENAVIYGLERTQDSALICINCYSADKFTVIEISNDGPSIPDEEKERIYRSFQQTEPGSGHIGLRNVYQRIKLFYGEPYSLSISDLIPHGAMIRLTLPPMQ